jgi:esterase/lipase
MGCAKGATVQIRQLLAIAVATWGLVAPASAQDKLGIVLMHGKEGLPGQLALLGNALAAAGFMVERPEMCWSRRRIYDHSYLDCLRDADEAAERLKSGGATGGIVIAGVGLGGNAALAYGARREGLKAVIAMGPAPPIEFLSKRPAIARSLAEAQQMVASGRGNQRAIFADLARDRQFDVETTATIYVTFFAPDAPGIMPDNAAKLKAPLLIVSAVGDTTQRSIPYVFARAPDNRLNWHVTVPGDFRSAVGSARNIIPAWLKLVQDPPRAPPAR